MALKAILLLMATTLCLFSTALSFHHQSTVSRGVSTHLSVRNKQRKTSRRRQTTEKENKPCDPCAEEDENPLLDRREAVFATLGTLWAAGTLPTALIFPGQAAHAAYGEDARISLPNPIEGMAERASKQCLVESLGTRECLIYADDANKLYKGADNQVLLTRVEKATSALATLPPLIETKKWSQVNGVLTGPLGELVRTMGQLADLSESATARGKIKTFKADLYSITAAIDRKDVTAALKGHADATKDLVAFLKDL